MLVSAKDTLEKVREGKYAVGQFNISNLEWTKSVLLTIEELKSPAVLGVSEGAGKYITGFKTVVVMVRAVMEELDITIPAAPHLDRDIHDGCYKCIKAGSSSTVFDGSHYPIEESIEKIKELVKIVHAVGLFLETEAGSIGGEEDGAVGLGECADPRECRAITDLEIDPLAADIGSVHSKYPENWPGLCFDVLEQVKAVVGSVPLVLHDSTGVPEDAIKKATSLGVAKTNINTECQLSFAVVTKGYIEAGENLKGRDFNPKKLLAPGADVIRTTVKEKMELLGSVGKA